MKIGAIILDTFRELMHRKTLPIFFGIITLTHLFFLLALHTDVAQGSIASLKVLGMQGSPGGAIPVDKFVSGIQVGIAFVLYPLGILLAVFSTASLVPRMLEKGSIDLLLSKPVSRPVLFASRFLGAFVVASAHLLYLALGIGIILGAKTGIWNGGFLLSGLMVSLYFGALLGFLVLVGVLLRSTSAGVMITALIFLVSLVIHGAHQTTEWIQVLSSPIWRISVRTFVEVVYHVLPRTYDFARMAGALTLGNEAPILWPALNTLLSGAAALALATLYFARKDY